MQRLPPRRGKLSAKRTDEGRACPARGLLAGASLPFRGGPDMSGPYRAAQL